MCYPILVRDNKHTNEREDTKMTQRRKSLSDKDIRTIVAVMESFREQNHNRFNEMNRYLGSMTIEDMVALQSKLENWLGDEVLDEYEDVELDEYRESYSDYISSYIY